MNLRTRDGQITLGSVFKLVATAYACFGVVVFGGLFLLLFLIGLGSGSMVVNGEMVQGRGPVFTAMLPALIIVPLAVALQSVIFGGFVTAGAALYRLRKPLTVTAEQSVPPHP